MSQAKAQPDDWRWRHINVMVRTIPDGTRTAWLKRTIQSHPSLERTFRTDKALTHWHDDPLSAPLKDCWPNATPTSLDLFHRQLSYFFGCHRECAAISRCLNHRRAYLRSGLTDPLDLFHSAIAEHPRLIKLANADPDVGQRVRKMYETNPPKLDDLVPPLALIDLRNLRKCIDRDRNRIIREGKRRVAELLEWDEVIEQTYLEALIETETTKADAALLKEALNTLDPLDPEILWLDAKGHAGIEIAEIIGRSPSTVSERMARAIVRLKHYIDQHTVGGDSVD